MLFILCVCAFCVCVCLKEIDKSIYIALEREKDHLYIQLYFYYSFQTENSLEELIAENNFLKRQLIDLQRQFGAAISASLAQVNHQPVEAVAESAEENLQPEVDPLPFVENTQPAVLSNENVNESLQRK